MIEQEWVEEPRRLTEIVESIGELIDKVWYNRHQVRREMIEDGRIELVEKETFPIKDHAKRPIQRDIWKRRTCSSIAVDAFFCDGWMNGKSHFVVFEPKGRNLRHYHHRPQRGLRIP